MKKDKVIIFDTTLRDGEQSPGASLNNKEKLEIAFQLARLGVDVIEAGFPITSQGDFDAVKTVAKRVKGVEVCGLARANKKDIDACWSAVKYSDKPRIHTFIATSDIHLKSKLKKTRQQVLEMAVEAVKYAAKYTDNVEFSAEDASRSDFSYLLSICEAVSAAGAKSINIPDTVGYAIPQEFGALIGKLHQELSCKSDCIISVHCHNDLGLGVANSLQALKNGARQVECTINGLGERAGNASLEEIVMALATRKKYFNLTTNVNKKEIYKTSRLVSTLTGIIVQPNKAIVGSNAFAHEAGIHQDGVIKSPLTYEIMTPESVGVPCSKLVLGKHSGRHAFGKRLKELGYTIDKDELERLFVLFKELADRKKNIYDEDLVALVENQLAEIPETFILDYLNTSSGTGIIPTATIRIKKAGKIIQDSACGDGPVDACCKAIDKVTGIKVKLADYSLRAVSSDKDAQGEVSIKLDYNNSVVLGRGVSTDIIEASARAYLNALNRIMMLPKKVKKAKQERI
ncbi:MAG: 2-isopropylmalate synthase [bacterium]